MNWVFMLDEIHKTRPEFWFELSTWDGDQPGAGNDKRRFYAKQGQLFTPARYEGFVQYGMWLTRPRVVRDFRGYLETIEYAGPYFQPILDAVNRVYRNADVLQKFWRQKGTLVANRKGKHPFQADIPPEMQGSGPLVPARHQPDAEGIAARGVRQRQAAVAPDRGADLRPRPRGPRHGRRCEREMARL